MDILASVPSATLAFIAPSDINNKFVQRILAAAEKHSISDRIDLIDAADFLKSRQEILLDADLVLDRFPRGNSDLVLECIWIGCPALAVWGGQPYDRSAASIARSAGLLELVASDAEDYKKRAISLAKSAKDRKKLRELLKKVNRDLNLSAYETTANELVEKSDALWRKWCMINA
jgi:predicted O-linked N-acetylglucosamine transferase (SPINDLY family)